MKEELKIQLKDFQKQYSSYKEYLEETDWTEDYDIEDSYKTEASIIDNIIRDIRNFSKENESSLHLKEVQKFFKYCNKIVEIHIKRIERYLEQNDWKKAYKDERDEIVKKMQELEKEGLDEVTKILYEEYKRTLSDIESSKRKEIKFQNDIFTQGREIRVKSLGLNIDVENNTLSPHLFHANKKASLIMRSFLYDKEPHLREKTDLLKINWESPNPATSKELYINMNPKDIPPYDPRKHFFEQSVDVLQFWEEEINKIKHGINFGGYHLSGFVYTGINYCNIPQGAGLEKRVAPVLLTDNIYYIDETLKEAVRLDKEAVMLYGSRRVSKSVSEAIYLTHSLLSIYNCSAALTGFSEKDLGHVGTYLDITFNNLPPALKPNINVNSDKEFNIGIKGRSAQDNYNMATLAIVNLDGGTKKNSTQKLAGFTPDAVVVDEALNEDELVVVKDGFKRIADVEEGDEIYDHTGKTTKVLKKIDVGQKQLYKVELRNGVSIEACGDHLWEVKNKFKTEKIEIKKTSELLQDFKVYGGRSKYSIRKTKPVEFPQKEVTIDPYFLGCWLGDGIKTQPSIVSTDDYILNYVEDYCSRLGLRFVKDLKKDGNRKTDTYTARIRKVNGQGKFNPLTQKLRDYGIYNNKRIPKDYLFNSVDVRLEVLRGIMDTDGTINSKSACFITLAKKDLFDDVRVLVESLGISAKCTETDVKGRTYYKMMFNTDLKVFNLPRKANKQRTSLSLKGQHNKEWVSIEYIEPTRVNQAYCLQVDNEDKLFLTTMFTVTHNCAKGNLIDPWLALRPALAGGKDGKRRTVALLAATAGEEALSKHAEKMIKNPKAYGILPANWDLLDSISDPEYITWKRGTFCTFMPAQMSLEGKKDETTLDKFLKIDNPELSKIKILKTDWKYGKEKFEKRRKEVESDYTAQASEIASFPLESDDVYLSGTKNKFNAIGMKKHQNWLQENEQTGAKYWFTQNIEGQIELTLTNEPIITQYPYGGGSFDAPVQVFERVEEEPPFGLYVIGLDDVKHDQSDGDSVISCTVYKRNWELSEWADRIVCTYATRPDRKEEAYKVIRLIMKYYNAIVFPENEDEGFKDFLERRHKLEALKHLAEGVDFSRSLNLDHNNNRAIGFSASIKNINRLNSRVLAYTQDPIEEGGELDGYIMINDTMLLEEMIHNKPGANADRIRSFGLALLYAEYLDKNNLYISRRRWNTQPQDGVTKAKTTKHTGLINKKFNKRRRGF